MIGQVDFLEGLNPPQLEAVKHINGAILVLAGAGSGKTRVLTSRVANLITNGHAGPEEILAMTFTNKAAGEMKARIEKLTGIDRQRMQVSTFHSFSARLLRFYSDRIGIDRNYTIYDEEDALALIKTCIKEMGFDTKTLAPRLVRSRISDAKSEMVGVEEYIKLGRDFITERIARVYEQYQKKLRAAEALDFDDLLFYTVKLLSESEEVASKVQNRYRYLLIDEYQDTNRTQYLMAKLLCKQHGNIFAVGDDDQSIYGWRGANINNILDFEKDFPNCKLIRLEQNYRSTQRILQAASTIISNNSMRKGKTIYSKGDQGELLTLLITENDRQEAEQIAIRIEDQIRANLPRCEIAILYRTNAQSRALEEALKNRFIAYKIVGGIRFYQRKEVKDVLAYLKLLENGKDDISFKRTINYPKRGIGATTIAKLSVAADSYNCSLLELSQQPDKLDFVSAATVNKFRKFVELFNYLMAKKVEMPLEPFIALVAKQTGIVNDLNTSDPVEAESRLENIEELATSAGAYQTNYPDAKLVDFLQEISLYTDVDNLDMNSDSITLMTLHAAKGLEFESVYVTGLEEGLFPLSRCMDDPAQLEEERRLMYVGMTRAKSKLTLSYAELRVRFGETLSLRSRFVDELPDELVDTARYTLFDKRGQVNESYLQPDYTDIDDPFAKIDSGSIVYHPRWGEGRVMKKSGAGESTEFEVRFTYAGIKRLLAKYAKLKLVR